MGSSMSVTLGEGKDDIGVRSRPRLSDLPEFCVACILMRMDPIQICKLARLNCVFSSASSADFIWESKLPSNYSFIIDRLLPDSPPFLNKKRLYSRLCLPISFDNGRKEAWIDKRTGGICISISARGLKITAVDDRRYWTHIPTDESRFQSVVYLQQTWWFEVQGEVEFPFPQGTYSIYFRLHLGRPYRRFGRRMCNTEHVHGWGVKPVSFHLTTSDGQKALSEYCLDDPGGGWLHCHVGDFIVKSAGAVSKVFVSAMQIDCTHTKGGLCVDSVMVQSHGGQGERRRT